MAFENSSEQELSLLNETLKELEFYSVLEYITKYCVSDPGRDIVLSLRPNEDIFWLRNEHDLIAETTSLLTEDDEPPLEGLNDVRPKFHKSLVAGSMLSTSEILAVRDVIRVSRLVKTFFKGRVDRFPGLADRAALLFENRLLEKHIDEAIDESGEVRDTASRELSRIRHDIIEKSARLRSRLQKILKRVSDEEMIQEEFVTLREGRYVLPVRAEHKRHVPGIIHGVSQTGSTVFMEPSEIIEMNNELSLLMNEEKREIYKILSQLTGEIGSEAREFLNSFDILSHLDSITARARYALEFRGIKPDITEDNEIILNKVYHPLLVHSRGMKNVIPLSLEFNNNKRGHLISGPNAGGKTVALKSIGLNIALALCGVFPLGQCRTNYRFIYSSIGDHQSIENNLSTFSSQIIQLRDIIDHCNNQTLVLIDEIGSGTDPQEGAALAAGILDSFLEMNVFFVVTTHQSSLKTYALTRPEIDNASLEFDEKKLVPTYKFLEGIPGNSYAFVLAENLGLSSLVLERARTYIGTRQTELEESISILQRYKSEAEEFSTKAREENLKAQRLRNEYENRYKDIKLKRKQIIDEARSEAYGIVDRANALIENTIREIREEKRASSEIKKDYQAEKKSLESQIKHSSSKDRDDRPTEEVDLAPGDSVVMEDSSSVGFVIIADKETRTALVDFNGLKFRMPYDQLSRATTKEKRQTQSADYFKFSAPSSIDLRGMRADEALREIDEFLNNAVMSNVSPLTIIHGKGTGALRKVVQEFLEKHPSVVTFRNGDMVEGGDGVTIVEL